MGLETAQEWFLTWAQHSTRATKRENQQFPVEVRVSACQKKLKKGVVWSYTAVLECFYFSTLALQCIIAVPMVTAAQIISFMNVYSDSIYSLQL